MDREIGLHTAAKVAGAFDLYYERGDWLWGAYMNQPDEKKKEWRANETFLYSLNLRYDEVKHWPESEPEDLEWDKVEDGKELDGPKVIPFRI